MGDQDQTPLPSLREQVDLQFIQWRECVRRGAGSTEKTREKKETETLDQNLYGKDPQPTQTEQENNNKETEKQKEEQQKESQPRKA